MARGSRSGSGMPGLGMGVGAVSVNTCASTDNSFFCQFSRIFQMITTILITLLLLFFVYVIFSTFVFNRRGGRSKGFF
jgi:hypothetical protein